MASRNINDLWNLQLFIIRKERGGFISPQQGCTALDAAQMEKFNEDFKFYQINQQIVDALSPFKTRYQFTSASDGNVTNPSDYQHLLGSVFTVSGSTVNPVHFVNEDELPNALISQLRPVTLTKPIAIDSAEGFQLYPQSQQTGFFTYLRRPAIPVLGYTQVGRDITYDPNTSTQLEYYDVYLDNIVARSMKYLGINLDEQAVQQFAQLQQQQTN